ncbi:MAG: polysaccharide deacetylase family protein [Clostridia bacterium]|nr:polysaccharide deacetylase family protein [Clostridia bacterium]
MKKFISCIIAVIILCSCTVEYNTSEYRENEKMSAENNTAVTYIRGNTIYGETTGTTKTYTGLEPLDLQDFSNIEISPSGLSTTKICHSYGVAKNGKAHEISLESQKFFEANGYNAVTLDTSEQTKNIYLTFDVGYDNGYTEMILDTLKEKGVSAAFFCTVDEMKSNPEAIARMINEGHIVGNHTDNHPSMDELTRAEMIAEIKGFDDYIRTNFGYSSPYFRFPKGEYSEEALDVVGDMGYMSIFWSLAYADWDTENQKSAQYAHDTVISRIHPGAVILLHAVLADNAYALEEIIDTAESMGYVFESIENYRKCN